MAIDSFYGVSPTIEISYSPPPTHCCCSSLAVLGVTSNRFRTTDTQDGGEISRKRSVTRRRQVKLYPTGSSQKTAVGIWQRPARKSWYPAFIMVAELVTRAENIVEHHSIFPSNPFFSFLAVSDAGITIERLGVKHWQTNHRKQHFATLSFLFISSTLA